MDSADKQKIVGTSVLCSLLLIYLSNRLPEEVVFPGHAAYFIITFYLTYPDSDKIRHFFVTLTLTFGDFFYLELISNYEPKNALQFEKKFKNPRVLLLEFFSLFIVVKMMSKKEIYTEFKNSILRTIVFLLEGFIKARGLIESLKIITGNQDISEESFVKGLVVCGIQSMIPGIVYLVDTFFCLDVPLRQISVNGIAMLGKTGVVISGLGMIIEIIQKNFLIAEGLSWPCSNLAVYFCFFFIYTTDSLRYARHFTRKSEG